MSKRETEHFAISKGLKLWYVYNMRAIMQSSDLCRVVTSHRGVMQHPKAELDRIYAELRDSCGVQVPLQADEKAIKEFVDINLQHGKTSLKDQSCNDHENSLATFVPPDTWKTTDETHLELYRECMRVYCAMEDGTAFKSNFKWKTDMKDS